jgi:hypothetical protein
VRERLLRQAALPELPAPSPLPSPFRSRQRLPGTVAGTPPILRAVNAVRIATPWSFTLTCRCANLGTTVVSSIVLA